MCGIVVLCGFEFLTKYKFFIIVILPCIVWDIFLTWKKQYLLKELYVKQLKEIRLYNEEEKLCFLVNSSQESEMQFFKKICKKELVDFDWKEDLESVRKICFVLDEYNLLLLQSKIHSECFFAEWENMKPTYNTGIKFSDDELKKIEDFFSCLNV